jgi:glycosyltransferase involved in cell wall biosynthesis
MGAGKEIISTPYRHAAEVLNPGRGALVPFENPAAIAIAAIGLLENDPLRQATRERANLYPQPMVWNRVAQSYIRALVRASISRMQPASRGVPVQAVEKNAAQGIVKPLV